MRASAAVERLAGLQAQWAPSPYLALWARLDGFKREQLERALVRESVLKATLMRATLHLVSAADYPLFAAGVREAATLARTRGVDPPPAETVAAAVELARRKGRVTRRELLSLLGYERPPAPTHDPRPQRQLQWLLVLAQLEQAPEAARWSPPRVTPFRRVELPLAEPEVGRVHLARRYLAAYGPASRADLACWSRVPLRDLDPALSSLRLRHFRDEGGRDLVDLPGAPIAAPRTATPVRFLPRWDELLLAYDRRERVLPERFRRTVIAPNGDVLDTFLVDGFVAGSWRRENGRVVAEPFEPLPLAARRDVEDEARRLAAFLG
ncbi:MAG: AlkZ family DNA glycosylase [Thermoleophilia bacterium]|nr:AlkZ family DNA glycosylase [Thermoleophilia bacterium]